MLRNRILSLKELIQDVASWPALYDNLIGLEDDKNHSKAGLVFEVFCKYWLLSYQNEFEQVYLYNEVPHELKKKLRLPDVDHGIDLIAIQNNKSVGIQVKFRKDQSKKLSWSKDKLSNLIAFNQLDSHMVISNCSGIDKTTRRQGKAFQKLLINDLLELDQNDFSKIKASINKKKIKHKLLKPRAHQIKAIKSVVKGFKKYDRGKLILPCGAGKTLTSLWIKEKVTVGRTLVLLPSLNLLRQFKNTWLKNKKDDFQYLCVCSDSKIDQNSSDELDSSVDELGLTGLGVTTCPKEIYKHIKANPNIVVFCTYQSSVTISKSLRGKKLKFNIAICDEAHRTSGLIDSSWGTINDETKIPCIKRLYMTATPRVLSQASKNRLGDKVELIADMSNEEIYGPEFYKMSFTDGIREGFLCDYKIVAIGLKKDITSIEFNKLDYQSQVDLHVKALKKTIRKHKLKHVISFHSSIKRSKIFQENFENVLKFSSYHVSGKVPTAERSHLIHEKFSKDKKSLITNARCLTEGIDVPNVDSIYFADSRKSLIDIVQAVGRALRISEGKEYGYIVVPILQTKKEDIEDAIKNGAFKTLINVLRALSSHDSRVEEQLKIIAKNYSEPNGREKCDSLINLSDFENHIFKPKDIFLEYINKSFRYEWKTYADATQYVSQLGLQSGNEYYSLARGGGLPPDIPRNPESVYKKDDFSWGGYLGTGRVATAKREFLPYEDSRNYAQSLKLPSVKAWMKYCKENELPEGVPTNPQRTYEDQWEGWSEFLGNGVLPKNRTYLSFKEAKQKVKALGITKKEDYKEYFSASKPLDLPSNPNKVYEKEWVGWGDFLGKKQRHLSHDKKWYNFAQAKKIIKKLKLKNQKEWQVLTKKGLPQGIPSVPERVYKDQWKGWGDFLGNGNKSNHQKKNLYPTFKQAKNFLKNKEISSVRKYVEFIKSKECSLTLPYHPERAYKSEWKDWGDYLSHGRTSNNILNAKMVNYDAAKNYLKNKKLSTRNAYRKFIDSSDCKKILPKDPAKTYRDQWESWGIFLGKIK